jgi:molybdopterin converting factor subunit 1
MRVRILFFGVLKDLAGKSNYTLELREGATVREMLAQCEAQLPRIKTSLPSLAVAVNQQYANMDAELKAGDEVALLPPVSGGSQKESAASHLPANHSFIVSSPIDTTEALERIQSAEDGAAVVFEGVVRNHTRERKTLYLDYEAYEEMALREMENLAEKALQQYQIRDLALVHRLGRLEIGETSVLIVVASAHRAAAFDACRWLIDTLKRTVPIWKKEYFEDGAVWADGEPFPAEISSPNSQRQGSPARADASK